MADKSKPNSPSPEQEHYLIKHIGGEENEQTRTELPSLAFGVRSVAISIIGFAFIMIIEVFYKKPLWDYSVGPNGIQSFQDEISEHMKKVWKLESALGGGKEIMVFIGVTFFWGRRSKLMYYLIFFALDKSCVNYFKLAYHDPRPYMINSNIKPISCSRAFGNPSGHASSSLIVPIVVFLDIFHGKTHKYHKPEFFATPPYVISLFLAIFWPATIPFTRYVLGVHSLDQILFGVSLGIWGGLTCHFVIRDHVINHMEESFRHQGLITQEEEENSEQKYGSKLSGSQINEAQDHQNLETSQSAAEPVRENEFPNPKGKVICVIVLWLVYVIASIVTFFIVDAELGPDSDLIKLYTANFQKECGPLNLTYSFQNASLNGAGYCTLTLVSYICMLYRSKLLCCQKQPNQIKMSDLGQGGCKGVLIKILLVAVLAAILVIPAATLKLGAVGSAIIILVTNVVIPTAVAGYLLLGGPFDLVVYKLFERMNIK